MFNKLDPRIFWIFGYFGLFWLLLFLEFVGVSGGVVVLACLLLLSEGNVLFVCFCNDGESIWGEATFCGVFLCFRDDIQECPPLPTQDFGVGLDAAGLLDTGLV